MGGDRVRGVEGGGGGEGDLRRSEKKRKRARET